MSNVTPMLSCGIYNTIGLKSDGSCECVGYSYYTYNDIKGLVGLKYIASGENYTVGVKDDGTCVAAGQNSFGGCNVSQWADIKQIDCGIYQTVGLKNDGTCVLAGYRDSYYMGNVSQWADIKQVACGRDYFSVGLKNNGTCVYTGSVQLSANYLPEMAKWTDIKQVSCKYANSIVGLKNDGTCVYVGSTYTGLADVNIKQVLAIGTLGCCFIALKNDGTCCLSLISPTTPVPSAFADILNWTNIAQIACYISNSTLYHIVGVKKDGTCVAVGINLYGETDISDWRLYMYYKGLLQSKAGINCLTATSVDGFDLTGVQPADTNRRAVFKIDGSWSKLASNGTLTAVTTQTPTADSVLSEGNTVDELAALTAIPSFVGKTVYPAIALYAPNGAEVMPSLGMSIKTKSNQDQFSKDEYSQEYHLADTDVDIVSITADTTTTGQATVSIQASLKQSGEWSAYMPILSAKGQKASDLKYKSTYIVTTIGGADTAKVNSITATYCAGSATVSGDTAELLSITQNYQNGLGFAQCVVKHKALRDAVIKAFVSFRAAPKKREMINIATGNGETQTVQLGISNTADTGINHNTLGLQFDGKATYDYSYNTETSEVTFTAAEGVAVTASYDFGWEPESWVEMTKTNTQAYNDSGLYASKFEYTLSTSAGEKTISNVKVQLYRPSGTVANELLGLATGKRQIFLLPHYAKKETITCTGSWSYDDTSRILTVVAAKDTEIKISYTWLAESHIVNGLTVGWAED